MIWANMLKETVYKDKSFFESLSSNRIKKVSIGEGIFIVPYPFFAIEDILFILFISSIKMGLLSILGSIV